MPWIEGYVRRLLAAGVPEDEVIPALARSVEEWKEVPGEYARSAEAVIEEVGTPGRREATSSSSRPPGSGWGTSVSVPGEGRFLCPPPDCPDHREDGSRRRG